MSNFSFSYSVFYLFGELFAIFIKFKIAFCQRFQYGGVKKLSFGKGLNWNHFQTTNQRLVEMTGPVLFKVENIVEKKGENVAYKRFLLFEQTSKVYFLLFTIQNHDFQRPCIKSPLKTLWEKEKMLVTSIFSFSHNVFYPSQNKLQLFNYIYFVVCKCFQFGPVQFFVVW